jgi:NO-binding membrane sensor protein with MHYT domain
MTGYYNLSLVALSVAIATIASYTALDLANRVSASSPRKSWLWLAAGAISMGTGIWAMHFIGMLAFHLPIPIAYDLSITGASMLIAIAVSAVALFVLRQPLVSTRSWVLGATLMGIGISAMHYTGMMAMRMLPAIQYDPLLFITSVLIAVLAALAALWIALQLRGNVSRFAIPAKLASAGVMGLAITGMHYTGMAAAHFAPASVCLAAVRGGGLQNTTLAIIIGCIAMAILSLTIVLSTLDAHFAVKNERLAASLQVAKDAADAALGENERITAQLRAAQSELLGSARRAGMAEIANSVLHNVGNVLNSVNVSAQLIETRVRESKTGGIGQAVQLMSEHAAQLGNFLSNDVRGQRLPGYLGKLAESLAADKSAVLDELSALTRSIEHIKEIVTTQQTYAGANSILEPVRINELVEDALRMTAGSKSGARVAIVKDLQPGPAVLLDKHLMLQILINLITNARQAMDGVPERPYEIRIWSEFRGVNERRLLIGVEDNGEGIEPDNLTRLFAHGFTTRKSGHGFGLHSSALAAKTLGGALTAHSEGLGHGAVFTLEVAVKGLVENHEHA